MEGQSRRTVLQPGPGRVRVAPIEGDQPQVQGPLLHQRRVVLVGRELAALLAHRARPTHLGPEQLKPGEALERLAVVPRLPQALRQRESPGVALAHGRRRVPVAAIVAVPGAAGARVRAGPRGALGRVAAPPPFGEGGDSFVIGPAPDGRV